MTQNHIDQRMKDLEVRLHNAKIRSWKLEPMELIFELNEVQMNITTFIDEITTMEMAR